MFVGQAKTKQLLSRLPRLPYGRLAIMKPLELSIARESASLSRLWICFWTPSIACLKQAFMKKFFIRFDIF
jgi:hypothetical protein